MICRSLIGRFIPLPLAWTAPVCSCTQRAGGRRCVVRSPFTTNKEKGCIRFIAVLRRNRAKRSLNKSFLVRLSGLKKNSRMCGISGWQTGPGTIGRFLKNIRTDYFWTSITPENTSAKPHRPFLAGTKQLKRFGKRTLAISLNINQNSVKSALLRLLNRR